MRNISNEKAWKDFILDSRDVSINPIILESWKRSKNNNLDYTLIPPIEPSINRQRLLKENRTLLDSVYQYRKQIMEFTLGKNFIFSISNCDGVLIDVRGDEATLKKANNSNIFVVGSIYSENVVGANAISLAIKEGKPIEIVGSEHYNQNFHKWTCSSAPILDINNKVVGVATFTTHLENSHVHALPLITALAKEIEKVYKEAIKEDIQKNSNQFNKNTFTFENIIGKSPGINEVITTAKIIADSDVKVIIEGESGTGKELIVQSIHNHSSRKLYPFIAINCGSIPANLIESELFGYSEGAFTGAKKGGAVGKFVLADKGTIFLDEINSMPIEMQIKLLRVLQQNEVVPVGSNKSISIDVRVIAATNVPLKKLVKENKFREDLYYRLSVFELTLPPLRNRKEDIILLFEHLLEKHCKRVGLDKIEYEDEIIPFLLRYDWPGNIREMENYVERVVVLAQGGIIKLEYFPSQILNNSLATNSSSVLSPLEKVEKDTIVKTLNAFNGNISRSAKALGITRKTLYKKLNEYNITEVFAIR